MPSRFRFALLPILLALSGIVMIFSLLAGPAFSVLARDEERVTAVSDVVPPAMAVAEHSIQP